MDCLLENICRSYKKYEKNKKLCAFFSRKKNQKEIQRLIILENIFHIYVDASNMKNGKLNIDPMTFCEQILAEKQKALEKLSMNPIPVYFELYQILHSWSDDAKLVTDECLSNKDDVKTC